MQQGQSGVQSFANRLNELVDPLTKKVHQDLLMFVIGPLLRPKVDQPKIMDGTKLLNNPAKKNPDWPELG